MTNGSSFRQPAPVESANPPRDAIAWHSFPQILQRLHQEKILIHPDQLAEFMLMHGLPVDPQYVPQHLQQKAHQINTHYQGDLARLESTPEPTQMFLFE
ncbi:hypothetical protein [Pantanalinema sp. GBBB05]|uniref:hypothetical protein n=1 Tax=Pantanalinema sp. GBBB05 TaxID=2604139 RepID=UPI001D970F63|nr:hypothetical protein [Pantanalinema sp. GBBB05]